MTLALDDNLVFYVTANIRTRDGRTALSEGRSPTREFHIFSWLFVWKGSVGDDNELVRLLVEAGAKP